jgi:hypothetical protein
MVMDEDSDIEALLDIETLAEELVLSVTVIELLMDWVS